MSGSWKHGCSSCALLLERFSCVLCTDWKRGRQSPNLRKVKYSFYICAPLHHSSINLPHLYAIISCQYRSNWNAVIADVTAVVVLTTILSLATIYVILLVTGDSQTDSVSSDI